jgi:hypothetical protein
MNSPLEKSIYWRGLVLHEISMLELMINAYIGIYLCGKENPDKILDMVNLFLGDDRTSLSSKSQVFYWISSNKDKTWYSNYTSIRIPDPKKAAYGLNSDMSWVIEQRNIFAHRVVSDEILTPDLMQKGIIRYVKFKNEMDVLDYSEQSFKILIGTIINLTKYVKKRNAL